MMCALHASETLPTIDRLCQDTSGGVGWDGAQLAPTTRSLFWGSAFSIAQLQALWNKAANSQGAELCSEWSCCQWRQIAAETLNPDEARVSCDLETLQKKYNAGVCK